MPLPEDRLSTLPVPAPFLPPRDKVVGFLESWHRGGIALNDPTAGLDVQDWHATSDGSSVFVSAPNWPTTQLFFVPGAGISSIDLAFDQNMNPAIAYVEGGQAKLYWFDTLPNAYVVFLLDPLDKNPRLALDDHRPISVNGGNSDMILAYTRQGSLYYRQQRDRFTIERLLVANTGLVRLLTIGMTTADRFQFFFGGDIPPYVAPAPVVGGSPGPFQPVPPPVPVNPLTPPGSAITIPNLNFEAGPTGWSMSPGAPGTFVISNVNGLADSGLWYGRYTGSPGGMAAVNILTDGVLVLPGTPVIINGRVRIISTDAGITSVTIRVVATSVSADSEFADVNSIISTFKFSSALDGTLPWTDLDTTGFIVNDAFPSPVWLRVGVVIQNPVGVTDVLIDNFTVTATGPLVPITLPNPEFSNGLTGWNIERPPFNPVAFNSPSSLLTVINNPATAFSGNFHARWVGSVNAGSTLNPLQPVVIASDKFLVGPSNIITVQMRARVTAVSEASNLRVFPGIDFFSQAQVDGVTPGSFAGVQSIGLGANVSSTYSLLNTSIKVPTDAVMGRITLFITSTSDTAINTIDLDSVSITVTTS